MEGDGRKKERKEAKKKPAGKGKGGKPSLVYANQIVKWILCCDKPNITTTITTTTSLHHHEYHDAHQGPVSC
ncbi:hypothetical protein E2C01_030369 [Portunus trituberculatus]|uniref:Uncharacterized protein n=1 Tax=Portunus trituberculatus TaxID=210409 RepID=A0A5B7EV55_PORTR|nr:hypothetical protein [Portunus trituberculatus]